MGGEWIMKQLAGHPDLSALAGRLPTGHQGKAVFAKNRLLLSNTPTKGSNSLVLLYYFHNRHSSKTL